MVAVLLAVSSQYGFHGDEMYFVVAGQHPALGYVDQPPLTPLLSAAAVALLGPSPTAVRLLPAIEMALIVILVALIARRPRRLATRPGDRGRRRGRLGLPRRRTPRHHDRARSPRLDDRAVAAGEGARGRRSAAVDPHRARDRDRAREQGHAAVPGRRACGRAWSSPGDGTSSARPGRGRRSGSRWCCGSRTSPGRRRTAGRSSRWRRSSPAMRPTTEPRSFPCSGCSRDHCCSRSASRASPGSLFARAAEPWRAIGVAALVALGLVLVSGGKAYYAIGSASVFMAAGAIVVDRWLARGHAGLKGVALAVVAVLSASLIALLTLPILPAGGLRRLLASGDDPRYRQPGGLAAVRRDGGAGGRGSSRRTSAPAP